VNAARIGNFSSLTVTRRLWRKRPLDRLQQRFVLLLEVLGFKRQPIPHSCHVDEDSLHSRIWCAISHQPAFNGVLSAFHRSNHCHAAERMKSSPSHYTTVTEVASHDTALGALDIVIGVLQQLEVDVR
jgi:hypothetical protein